MESCKPPIETFDNDWHELWWDSSEFVVSKGRPCGQLHEVWQWMGDAGGGWRRCGETEWMSAEQAYKEGWRYVRPIKLLNEDLRMDGTPPTVS